MSVHATIAYALLAAVLGGSVGLGAAAFVTWCWRHR